MEDQIVQTIVGDSPLHAIDLVIIGIYVVGTLALGTFFGKYVKSAGDFFVASKALPFWAIGMSVVVSDIGATDFMTLSGAGYQYGIAAANFDWIGSMPAMAFAAFIFIPYFWRAGVFTIPEFLGKRYNAAVQLIHASIWGVFLLVMLSVMLWLTASMLFSVLQIPGVEKWHYVWGIAVVAGIYTVSGGLAAVVMTDVVQLVVMFVGGAALSILCLAEVGGWSSMTETILAMPNHENHFTLLLPHDSETPYPWTGIVFGLGIVMATGYMAGNQAVVQRTLGARTEWDAKGGMLFAGFLKVFIPALVMVPGLAAIIVIPDLQNADDAAPMMIAKVLPPGLKGLMFAALFAALMSSVDSTLNSATTIWTSDIYGRFSQFITGKRPKEHLLLILGRICTVVFILLGAAFAPLLADKESMYTFVQSALAMFQGPVFAILLLGIMWKRANQWGALAGLLLGVCFTTILYNCEGIFTSQDPFLFVAWWSFIFSAIVTVVVSLVTPAEPDEKTRGLVFGQVMQDGNVQRVLQERVD